MSAFDSDMIKTQSLIEQRKSNKIINKMYLSLEEQVNLAKQQAASAKKDASISKWVSIFSSIVALGSLFLNYYLSIK